MDHVKQLIAQLRKAIQDYQSAIEVLTKLHPHAGLDEVNGAIVSSARVRHAINPPAGYTRGPYNKRARKSDVELAIRDAMKEKDRALTNHELARITGYTTKQISRCLVNNGFKHIGSLGSYAWLPPEVDSTIVNIAHHAKTEQETH